MKPQVLLCPGPVMVEESVRMALMHPDIGHRSPIFTEMFEDIQKKIRRMYRADDTYYPLIISGSGTSANESVISSLFKENDTGILISNGAFGERLEEIMCNYGIVVRKPSFEWGEYPDAGKVERYIESQPDAKFLCMVYHETSSGMINPVYDIGNLCRKHGLVFFVDGVSATASEDIDVVRQNIDIITGVAGKGLGAFPGSAFICAKESMLSTIYPSQSKCVCLDLLRHYNFAKEHSQTPNTPNVTLFWATNVALNNLLDKGMEWQLKRYRECADIIRDGVKALGLKLLIQDESHMSNTLTSILLPKYIDVEDFVLRMECEEGYVVYPGKGKYYDMGVFQVANMGAVTKEHCLSFLSSLECLLESYKKENLKKAGVM